MDEEHLDTRRGAPHDDAPGGADPDDAGVPQTVIVHRSDDPDFIPSDATLIASVVAGVDRYTDTTVFNGIVYYYRVVPVGILPGDVRKFGNASAIATASPWRPRPLSAVMRLTPTSCTTR